MILGGICVALALPVAGQARIDALGLAPAGADVICNEPPDPQAIVDRAQANGFTIAPGALEALRRVGNEPTGRIIVGFKGPGPQKPAVRTVQSAKRISAGDVTALGCPVGSAAHVNWNSGSGTIQEYWTWHSIGGQTGKVSPPAGSCPSTTCNIYAWSNGMANRWYGSVSVYNTWYAFITSAGCGY